MGSSWVGAAAIAMMIFFFSAHTVHYRFSKTQESCRYMFQDGHAHKKTAVAKVKCLENHTSKRDHSRLMGLSNLATYDS